jgi:hypothetical protein
MDRERDTPSVFDARRKLMLTVCAILVTVLLTMTGLSEIVITTSEPRLPVDYPVREPSHAAYTGNLTRWLNDNSTWS